MINRLICVVFIAVISPTFVGCRTSLTSEALSDELELHIDGAVVTMQRTELYLGLKRPAGADITDAEFQAFLEEEVTPRFPSGYTVMEAEGRWRDDSSNGATTKRATIREPSRVLIILYKPSAEALGKISQIKNAYVDRFDQEAVMRTDSKERVEF